VIIPLRRSGMAWVLKGSHSFTCTPRVHPLTEWTIPYHKKVHQQRCNKLIPQKMNTLFANCSVPYAVSKQICFPWMLRIDAQWDYVAAFVDQSFTLNHNSLWDRALPDEIQSSATPADTDDRNWGPFVINWFSVKRWIEAEWTWWRR